jgi:hypothetical protein
MLHYIQLVMTNTPTVDTFEFRTAIIYSSEGGDILYRDKSFESV